MIENFLFVEKYRPSTVEACILPADIKKTFKEYVNRKEITNLLLSGTAGIGKTTIAKALCDEIGAEYIMLNGSNEGRLLETLRGTVTQFASTISLTDSKKVIIMDEFDGVLPAIQHALRALIEEFSSNCRFIFTCNYKNKIIDAIHSRCTCIEFKIEQEDRVRLSGAFFKRASYILDNEGIEYDKKVLVELIAKHFPDFRRTLNEIQRYSISGKIDAGILVNTSEEIFKPLFKSLKDKKFTEVRAWCASNTAIDSSFLFRKIYERGLNFIEPSSFPQAILILADYQYKEAFVADSELNRLACLVELMGTCKFL